MKQRVTRLSPHQNGKVAAVMLAFTSLLVVVPMALFARLMPLPPNTPEQAMPPLGLFLAMPFIYLVIGYLGTVVSCWIYNGILVRLTGGFEFTSEPVDEA